MTRETKIGLLVGLAFIIVIGILLSDHMTSTTEPVPAPLANTAGNVRDSVVAPVTDPPPITVVTSNVTPRDVVSNRTDQISARPPQAIVRVSGPADNNTAIEIRQTAAAATNGNSNPGNSNPGQVAIGNAAQPTGDPNALSEIARANGEQIVGVNGGGSNLPNSGSNPLAGGVTFRKYTAQPGDTLSKIAGRFLGGNTKGNRDLIARANPSLAADPNKIIVGRTYNIPTAASAPARVVSIPVSNEILPPAAPGDAQPMNIAPATPTATVANTPAGSDQSTLWYTVKDNDNLWSIAADQLGSGVSWTAIKELNADVLKGGDIVHPNMRLRLPARPVASAQ